MLMTAAPVVAYTNFFTGGKLYVRLAPSMAIPLSPKCQKDIADLPLPCAKIMFKPHGVNVSWSGERQLGAVIGTEEFR